MEKPEAANLALFAFVGSLEFCHDLGLRAIIGAPEKVWVGGLSGTGSSLLTKY